MESSFEIIYPLMKQPNFIYINLDSKTEPQTANKNLIISHKPNRNIIELVLILNSSSTQYNYIQMRINQELSSNQFPELTHIEYVFHIENYNFLYIFTNIGLYYIDIHNLFIDIEKIILNDKSNRSNEKYIYKYNHTLDPSKLYVFTKKNEKFKINKNFTFSLHSSNISINKNLIYVSINVISGKIHLFSIMFSDSKMESISNIQLIDDINIPSDESVVDYQLFFNDEECEGRIVLKNIKISYIISNYNEYKVFIRRVYHISYYDEIILSIDNRQMSLFKNIFYIPNEYEMNTKNLINIVYYDNSNMEIAIYSVDFTENDERKYKIQSIKHRTGLIIDFIKPITDIDFFVISNNSKMIASFTIIKHPFRINQNQKILLDKEEYIYYNIMKNSIILYSVFNDYELYSIKNGIISKIMISPDFSLELKNNQINFYFTKTLSSKENYSSIVIFTKSKRLKYKLKDIKDDIILYSYSNNVLIILTKIRKLYMFSLSSLKIKEYHLFDIEEFFYIDEIFMNSVFIYEINKWVLIICTHSSIFYYLLDLNCVFLRKRMNLNNSHNNNELDFQQEETIHYKAELISHNEEEYSDIGKNNYNHVLKISFNKSLFYDIVLLCDLSFGYYSFDEK